MTHHLTDQIPGLLSGETTREETLAAAAHLRTCPDCQQELVSAVVAHASLSSARRFAPDVVVSELDNDGTEIADAEAGAPLPDLSGLFARVRAEAAAPPVRSRRRRRVLAGAVAAAAAVGIGVAIAESVGSSSSPTGRTVALRAFGVGTEPATMQVLDNGRMRIDAAGLPRLGPRQTYEVWLTDDARTRMVQVGFLDTDNTAELTVASAVLAHYGDVEVSRQPADQTAKYSGVSVLRGSYR